MWAGWQEGVEMRVRTAIASQASWGLALVCCLASCEGEPGAPPTDAYRPPAQIVDCAVSGRSEPILRLRESRRPRGVARQPRTHRQRIRGSRKFPARGDRPASHRSARAGDPVSRRPPVTHSPAPGWGSPDCPGPPGASFSPHGIDLVRRDGRQTPASRRPTWAVVSRSSSSRSGANRKPGRSNGEAACWRRRTLI